MADQRLPPIPEGFELVQDTPAPQQQALPPIPEGFELVSQQHPMPPPQPAYDPTEGMSSYEKFMAGAGKSVADTWRGLQQIGGAVADAIPGVDLTDWRAGVQADIDEARKLDAPLMATGAGKLGNIAGGVAQTAIPVGGLAGRSAALLGKAAPYVGAATRGALFAGAQPISGDENRATNAVIGGISGAAGQALPSILGSTATATKNALSPAMREGIGVAKSAGIPLHASQVSDSRFLKTLSSVLNTLPFTGAVKAGKIQQEAFNRAVGRTFGADAPALTDDVMAQARQGISNVYNNVFNRNQVSLTPADATRMNMIVTAAKRDMTAENSALVQRQFERIIDEFSNGPIAGSRYQDLRGELASLAQDNKTGSAIKALRQAVDDAAYRSVGKVDADTLKQANSMWANMRTAEAARKQVSGAGDNIRPAALWPLVRNGSTKEMRALAKMGQNVLKDPIPNSGTQERQFAMGLLGLGGTAGAATGTLPLVMKLAGVGMTAGRAMNSPGLASLLLATQPARAAMLAGASRLAAPAPYILPAALMANATAAPLEINVDGGRVGPAPTAAEMEALRARMGRSP